MITSKEFPPLPAAELSEVAGRIRQRLADLPDQLADIINAWQIIPSKVRSQPEGLHSARETARLRWCSFP